jgi:hypothetical protein
MEDQKMFNFKISAKTLPALRTATVAAIVAVAPIALSHAAKAASPWSSAEKWVGHLASERLGAGGSSFFDSPEVAAELPRLFGPGTRARLDSYEQAGRVQQIAQYLVVGKCAATGCADGSATLVLDTQSQDVWVVLKRQAADGAERCWSGTRHYAVLPAAIQTAFNVD